MKVVGDATGDGLADVALASTTWGTDPWRTGRVYVVAAGGPLGGVLDDVPDQVRGTRSGEVAGFGLAGGDVTGDGAVDLVVGAPAVNTVAWPGAVHVFAGPFEGVHETPDATTSVFAEHVADDFGRAVVAIDGDGDLQADLVVGAQFAPYGESYGAVYLLPGSALVP